MSEEPPNFLHLFEGYGIEVEYMIVDKDSYNIKPISDQLIKAVSGEYLPEIEFDKIAWSNELMLHLIELKTNGPCQNISEQIPNFQKEVNRINELLEPFHAKLMPTGAHPWMDPTKEAHLWPHEYNPIYETYHRIFNCTGHGWANLQSTHLNLPFANDEEFAKLHTAIRNLLPIISVLSASTPIIDGKLTGLKDTRLQYYCINQNKVPSISGMVVPEVVETKEEYERKILSKMYDEIASYDTDKILQYEWLNSRGAIARFDRNTIEIRVVDVQESPQSDLAILSVIVKILEEMIAEKWASYSQQKNNCSDEDLYKIFMHCIRDGMKTTINDSNYLQLFGITEKSMTTKELWQYLLVEIDFWEDPAFTSLREPMKVILEQGNLAERIIQYLQPKASAKKMTNLYENLCQCLSSGRSFYV